jgi:hypothetical protein
MDGRKVTDSENCKIAPIEGATYLPDKLLVPMDKIKSQVPVPALAV